MLSSLRTASSGLPELDLRVPPWGPQSAQAPVPPTGSQVFQSYLSICSSFGIRFHLFAFGVSPGGRTKFTPSRQKDPGMAAIARFAAPGGWGPQRICAASFLGPFQRPPDISIRLFGAATIKTCRGRWEATAAAAVEPPAEVARAVSCPPFPFTFPPLTEASTHCECLSVGHHTATLRAFLPDPHADGPASSLILPLQRAQLPSPGSSQLGHQPPLHMDALCLYKDEGGNSDICTLEDGCRKVKYYCWNRNPSSRYPKKANNGARPKCRVMRKIRKRLRTGR